MGSKYKMTWVIDPEVKKASLGSVNQLPTLEVRQTAELGFLCPKWTERPIPSNLSMVILWANYGHTQVCPAPHISCCQAPTSSALSPWWLLVMVRRLPHIAPMGTSVEIAVVL